MSKHSIIITLAIWVIIPFLGFPSFWRTLFLVFSGLGIIFYTFLLRNEYSSNSHWGFGKKNDVYVENGVDYNNEKKNKEKE